MLFQRSQSQFFRGSNKEGKRLPSGILIKCSDRTDNRESFKILSLVEIFCAQRKNIRGQQLKFCRYKYMLAYICMKRTSCITLDDL